MRNRKKRRCKWRSRIRTLFIKKLTRGILRRTRKEPMTTITLSERVKTLLLRFLEVHMPKIVKDAKECVGMEPENDEWTTMFRVKDWKLAISVLAPEHEEDCSHADNGDDLAYEETCDECDPVPHRLFFHLSYKRTYIDHKQYCLAVTQESFLTWIQSLETEWKLCRCGETLRSYPSPKEDVCSQCYIHGYIRTEEQGGDCCVCHENDGRWIRFKCNHEIHYHCYRVMTDNGKRSMKCPLCREPIIPISDNVVDPYNV